MTDADAFLHLIRCRPDDDGPRLVYADWLDERGEHEEADRQRKWPAAKQWLLRFCRENNPTDEDPDERVISYEDLLDLGRHAVEEADEEGVYGFSCGNNMTMCDALRASSREFWENWSVVTGITLPPGEDAGYFGCAC